MVQTRSLMEKAVRAAIQRHLRGWAPYPHVQVSSTENGHRVQWFDENDMVNASKSVVIETAGKPSRRDFAVLGSQGERRWSRQDMHMMDCDEKLTARKPWAKSVLPESLHTLSSRDCTQMLAHLRQAFMSNKDANVLLELVESQKFTPANALHTALDSLALASNEETRFDEIPIAAPLARILLGHALQSERKAWACKIAQAYGTWTNMAAVAWHSGDTWHLNLIPQNNPILFCDYRWKESESGLVFHDKLPDNAPDDTRTGRGSYERYARSYHLDSDMPMLHRGSIHAVLSCLISPIEPDSVWVKPIVASVAKGLAKSTSISREYYSFMRAFEEKAFVYLSTRAATPEALAASACMSVSRSLEEPVANIAQWQSRLLVWNNAIEGGAADALPIEPHLFEGFVP